MTRDQEAFGHLLRAIFSDDSNAVDVEEPAEDGPTDTGQTLVERADWLSRPTISVGSDGKSRYFSLGLSSTSTTLWDEGLVVHLQDQAPGVPAWITDLAVLGTASPYARDVARSIVGEKAWKASDELLQESGEDVVIIPGPQEVQELRHAWRDAVRLLQLETQPLPEAVLDDESLALITDRWTSLHDLSSTRELAAARAEVASTGGTRFEWEVNDETIARDLAGDYYSPRSLWPLLSIVLDNDLAVVTVSRLRGPVERSLRVFLRLGTQQSVLLRPEVQDGEHMLRASVVLGGKRLELQETLESQGRPPINTFRYP